MVQEQSADIITPISKPASKPQANAAILYTASDFRTSGEKLMGRNAASEGFLQGFVKHANVNDFYCYAHQRSTFNDFSQRVQQMAAQNPVTCRWVSPLNIHALAEPGCFFTPDPNISRYAWIRRQGNQRAYSLCGITHTISSQGSIDLITSLISAPTQRWDTLICTSRVVKKSIEHLLGEWGAYLAERFGATTAIQPRLQLPVIPLGIDCSQFDLAGTEPEIRHKWRDKLGIGEDDIVFLFVGRLSFHAKAHPTPMYIALENAARQTGRKVHLIQSGWFANDSIANAFKEGADALCPSINMIYLDGRQPDIRKEIWFAADVFTSLSDNIQETFGLTPIEAMAAGLPVVVTDWDGYRDTVRHGVDGFTVPTMAPPPGFARDLALRFEMDIDNYDIYIGNTSHTVSVDIAATSRAYAALMDDAELRQRMGEAGKKRAKDVYDWKHVIAAYMDLWQELAILRQNVDEVVRKAPDRPANPSRDDPFSFFSSYPTTTIRADDHICLLQEAPLAYYQTISRLLLHNYGYHAPEALCQHLVQTIAATENATVSALLATIVPAQHTIATRALLEMAKIGLISIGSHNK